MFITEVTDPHEKPLKASDIADYALRLMKESGEATKAVVDFTTRKLLGEISQDNLMLLKDTNVAVMQLLNRKTTNVLPDMHILDVAGIMNREKLSQVYVTDQDELFIGTVNNATVFKAISNLMNPEEEGAVIMVQVPARDYQLSDLIRILELEGVKIFGVGA
jgi:acetoin utilization protein AcuB